MEYRRLGRAGVKLSQIGLGSWLTYGRGVAEDASAPIINRALDLGINFFDTADIYHKGVAEEVYGRLLRPHRRQDLVIATKLFWPMSDNVNDRGLSRKHIVESVENSLQRLQTDYLDIYQCHRFDPEVEIFETVRAMDDLIRQGKILYWGTSEWPALEIQNACRVAREINACAPVSEQPEYSIAARRVETNGVQSACEQEGIGMVVWSPLKQGVLSGKYSGGKVPAGSRLSDDKQNVFIKEFATSKLTDRVDKLRPIADSLGCSMAELALGWLGQRRAVTSIIVGATSTEQLEQNCKAIEVMPTDEQMAMIDEIFPPVEHP
jgi:voltage-dependent potassium channel beta subunit